MSRPLPPITGLGAEADTAEAMEVIGTRLGAVLQPGDLISLDGPLGAGKTVFVRGLGRGRGVDPRLVRSPTFVLHQVYGMPPRLHHVDLYRLGEGAAIAGLDFDSLLETAPVAVEWGGYADLAAWRPLRLAIDVAGGETRRLTVVNARTAPPGLLQAWRDAIRLP